MEYYQEKITTIHDFSIDNDKIIDRIEELKEERPAAIVLPMLYREVENGALQNIVDQLNQVKGINKVTIALAADTVEEYRTVVRFFEKLELDHMVVWCNGPRIQSVLEEMKEKDLDITSFKGKGKDVWIALGIASLDAYAIALHDADIRTYTKEMPARLLYPIVDPELDFFFNKGYYARLDLDAKKMHGRVYRLFVRPMLESLQTDINHKSEVLDYLQSFRYSLAGEFAMTSDMALNIRIPGDWGLEMGLLAEIYRNTALKRICQIDLGFYDHKHQELGEDKTEGLCKMVQDILKTMLRIVTETTDTQVSTAFLNSVRVKYKRLSQDLVRQYHTDAICNGITYNRHKEEKYVDMFARVIMETGNEYIENPQQVLLPDWTRALSAMPDMRQRLKNAAIKDREEHMGPFDVNYQRTYRHWSEGEKDDLQKSA